MAVRVTDLRGRAALTWGTRRRSEPVTTGVPFPPGLVFDPRRLGLVDPRGNSQPMQARVLERWADGSVRWALVDFLADAENGIVEPRTIEIVDTSTAPPPSSLQATSTPDGVAVDSGRLRVRCSRGGSFPFSTITPDGAAPMASPSLTIDVGDGAVPVRIASVEIADGGPVRAELAVTGAIDGGGPARDLIVFGRLELFRDTSVVRLSISIRNTRRARHPRNQWVLGDAGSIEVRALTLTLPLAGVETVYAADDTRDLRAAGPVYELFQASSGGEHWQSPVHRDARGAVTLPFRGFRRRSADGETAGLRASPIVVATGGGRHTVVALPRCWQTFPRAIAVDTAGVAIACVPREAPIELQGGEQHTTVVGLAFDGDATSDPPLAWCHDPAIVTADPDWVCSSGAVPCLVTTTAAQADHEYRALVDTALDPAVGFERKRESADEYGWRHFGDLVADHESAFQPADRPLTSHYNNQYDAIAGFALQFLRSGDIRWWRFMDELARHVRDIDIYHATDDKAAYNGGLFWHTLHYVDAGTSTHRTYPAGGPAGGGPSAEHNYATGLMLHYFLTGDPASRDAAIGLGQWVLDMDDGARTPFRWLARTPTGLASATGTLTYQGPGRGPANSILSCLAAYRLTGDSRFLAKADELIRRCIHPNDDVDARDLLDAERRWYYTVFLQALAVYLQFKSERAEFDAMFAYAQASLLRYARWMAEHEQPYLQTPERLEFPTETWVAQDMRKAEVFYAALTHAREADRPRLLDRARFFRHYATSTLLGMPTHDFTRPIVLLLTNGLLGAWCERHLDSIRPARRGLPATDGPSPPAFVPQKIVAMRRALWIAAAIAAAAALGAVATFG